MKKYEIPDFNDPQRVYLRRWNLIVTPWFAIKVHHIILPDGDRILHDHPWAFATFILSGGYIEELPCGVAANGCWETLFKRRKRFSLHMLRANGLHRIHALVEEYTVKRDGRPGRSTWTLVFTTGYKRDWGFSSGPQMWTK